MILSPLPALSFENAHLSWRKQLILLEGQKFGAKTMRNWISGLFFCLLLIGFGHAQGTANEICPILVGQEIPETQLTSLDGQTISTKDLTKRKATIWIIYRGGWCPYCNRHLSEMAKIEDQLLEMGFQILAISPDKPEELSKTLDKHELKYSLFSDSQLAFSDALGLSFQVDDATLKKYKTFGIDLEAASGQAHHRLPVPALLISDKSGVLRFSYINPDYKHRADADLILAGAKAALK